MQVLLITGNFMMGETKQLLKYDVFGQKKKAEEVFVNWAKGKPAYSTIFEEWGKPTTHGGLMQNIACT
jgi:hypothetical protein